MFNNKCRDRNKNQASSSSGINPEITWMSEEQNEWYEGCFSTSRVCGIVSRPDKVKIKAYSEEGKIVEEEYSGYTARIFQHEIDHLDGILFIDNAINLKEGLPMNEDRFKKPIRKSTDKTKK